MEKKKNITINISTEEIRDWLKRGLVSDHSDLIASVIVEHLSATEVGLEHLYKALNGIKVEPKFKIGQKVWVFYDYCHTWKMHRGNMKEANLVFGENIKGEVIDIDMTQKSMYKVKYLIIDSNGHQEEIKTDFEERHVSIVDMYPLNM